MSVAYGYGKANQKGVKVSLDSEGGHGFTNPLDLGCEPGCGIAQISAKRLGPAMWKLRFMLVFMVIDRCLWVWKSKSEGSEGVFGLRRGPWLHKSVGFGVSRAAEWLRFQQND